MRMASATFSGVRPPARMLFGQSAESILNCVPLSKSQGAHFPVPPNVPATCASTKRAVGIRLREEFWDKQSLRRNLVICARVGASCTENAGIHIKLSTEHGLSSAP